MWYSTCPYSILEVSYPFYLWFVFQWKKDRDLLVIPDAFGGAWKVIRTAEYCAQRVVIMRAPAYKWHSQLWSISSFISGMSYRKLVQVHFKLSHLAHWLVLWCWWKFGDTAISEQALNIVVSDNIIIAATTFSHLHIESSGGTDPCHWTLSASSRNVLEVNILP